jgi:tail tube protein
MPTQAIAAYGIQVQIGTTTIPELVSISELGGQFGIQDVSAHDGSGWSSKIPTLLDGGTVRLVLNFVPTNAQHIALKTAMLARTSTAFRVLYPPAGSPIWTFSAFVTNYRVPGAPVNGQLQLNVDLTVDGPITMN